METPEENPFRSGYVALCGRPNVGKSTLVNALIGESVALATALPQTTREKMLGIWNGSGFQVVLVDTPGIHRARSALNRFMVEEALGAAREVEFVLLLVEAPSLASVSAANEWEPGEAAQAVLAAMREADTELVLVLTKVDQLPDPQSREAVVNKWRELHEFGGVFMVSAFSGEGIDQLRREVLRRLQPGPAYYDPEQLSDRGVRWHAAELIRGQLIEKLREELPYSCAVVIDKFEERAGGDRIRATIHVERDSQRGIVIGAKGKTIKAISTQARADIAKLTGQPCELFLRVEVSRNWSKDPGKLERLGYVGPRGAKNP